jgi:putative holliday junction resolvase
MTSELTAARPKVEKTLAIDYGTKRIGLARSVGGDSGFAEPWQVLELDKFEDEKELIVHLLELCEQAKISRIVVGISENVMAEKTKAFIKRLEKQTKLPIFTADETLSSQSARFKLRTAKLKKRRGPVDHYAAAEFLEEWLEMQDPV